MNKIFIIIMLAVSLSACAEISKPINSSLTALEEKFAVNVNDARQVLVLADQKELYIPDVRKRSVSQIVFPRAIKVGLILGGNYSEGFIFKDVQVLGRIRMSGGNLGPQLGGQEYSQVMYIMTEKKLDELMNSTQLKLQGTVSYAESGDSKTTLISTQNGLKEIHTLVFNQTGYLAGITLDGVVYSIIEKY